MHKTFKVLKRNAMPALFFLVVATLFTSCLKNNNETIGDQPAAGIMAFNLAPSQVAVGFALSNSKITNASLGYTSFTGNYIGIYPGSGTIQAFNFGANSIIASAPATFENKKYYSVFLVGDTTFQNIVVEDKIDSLPAITGTAYVRYINAIPDSTTTPVVKITAGGTDVFNGPAAFKTVSGFVPVAAGSISINATNETTITASRTIEIEAGKIYTILLIGKPGATETEKQVQVKFISNGTIAP